MKNNDNAKDQKTRLILLICMSVIIFGTAVMIITALLTLTDLRNDVKQMNNQMDLFQEEMIRARGN
jgi:hypothetical protein